MSDLQPETVAVRKALAAEARARIAATGDKMAAVVCDATHVEWFAVEGALDKLDAALREARAASERWARKYVAGRLRSIRNGALMTRAEIWRRHGEIMRWDFGFADALRDADIHGPDDLAGWEQW